MKLFKRKKINLLLFLNLFCLSSFLVPEIALPYENKNIPTSEYIKRAQNNNFYILGPGDLLEINISDQAIDLKSLVFIDGEGYADLKRLKKVYISGLTIKELVDILNKEYTYYVREPDVEITVIKYRPVKILLEGEVSSRGSYNLLGGSEIANDIKKINNEALTRAPIFELSNPNQDDFEDERLNNELNQDKRKVFFPTVIDAIRSAGGPTVNSDLTRVKITRINSLSNGGGRIATEINLLKALNFEDVNQNIRIYDGDTITIPKSKEPLLKQLKIINEANLQPKFINVFVGGRVENKGFLKINRSTTLVEALLLGGGAKIIKGPVQFVRYENDGGVDHRKFRYSRSAKKGSYKNPYLQNGDYIVVGKSGFNLTTEVINEITSPFQGIASTIRVYKFLRDGE